ncbi:MAG: imelysin family protein [Salipiger marinus]|uniref:imelysin family protein n=1 Tax=Salipiger marinus TaxID=555512 RepID=UPI004058CCB3
MILRATLCLLCLASPLRAGVPEALTGHILPGYAGFAEAAGDLAEAARQDCTAPALRARYQLAFDAWTVVGDIRMGPSETGALAVVFWPDARGFTPRTLQGFIADQAPVGRDPAAYAEASIAARGLFALEQMLYEAEFAGYAPGSYACALVQTMTADMAAQAQALQDGWRDGFAPVLLSAGGPGNASFLSETEAMAALYTQVMSSLEVTADTRLGRPLGSFDRPRPTRAEAWRAGRSLRNVLLYARAARDLAVALAPGPLPQTDAALARLEELAGRVSDPGLQDLDDPAARLRLEIVQQQVRTLRDTVGAELGAPLGLSAGFNSADGD